MHNKHNPFLHLPESLSGHEYLHKQAQEKQQRNDLMAELCYEIFILSEDGQKLMELFGEEYFTGNLLNPAGGNLGEQALYWQAFTEFPRMMLNLARQHKERKEQNVRNDTES
jgi:hypothetical protein